MAGYKVSYKVLSGQGEEIRAVARQVEGYAERVGQIRNKLGSDGLLSEVRGNLQRLQTQLGESRSALGIAGDFLVKTVESYSGVETRQVKKVDGTRAHNRDFYKNPVVVASAGGAAAAGSVASAPAAASVSAAVNYTDNSVNISYAASEPAADVAVAGAASQPMSAEASSVPVAGVTDAVAAPPPAPPFGDDMTTGMAVGGVLGGAIGAGGMLLKKKRGAEQADAAAEENAEEEDSPEAALEKAIARVRALEEKD